MRRNIFVVVYRSFEAKKTEFLHSFGYWSLNWILNLFTWRFILFICLHFWRFSDWFSSFRNSKLNRLSILLSGYSVLIFWISMTKLFWSVNNSVTWWRNNQLSFFSLRSEDILILENSNGLNLISALVRRWRNKGKIFIMALFLLWLLFIIVVTRRCHYREIDKITFR